MSHYITLHILIFYVEVLLLVRDVMLVALQDIYSLFHLNRPFKFISKTSNFLIPIIGWSMFMTGGVCSWGEK